MMLVALSGLPGTGKSTIARHLARDIDAVWLRIDSIEQAIRASGALAGDLYDAGYRAGYAVAHDNLAVGRAVVVDCVNPWMLTRDAWRSVAGEAGAPCLEVEIVCSDEREHRRRVETRQTDIAGLTLPDWAAVTARDYRPWERPVLTVDTAGCSVADCVKEVRRALGFGSDAA